MRSSKEWKREWRVKGVCIRETWCGWRMQLRVAVGISTVYLV